MSEWNWSAERRTAIGDVANQSLEYVAERLLESRKRVFDAEHKGQQLQTELDALKAAHTWIKTSERMPDGSAVMAAKQMLSEVLLLRARLDAMPHDRTWTKDKPTPGKWWLSIAPEKRTSDDFLAVFGSAVVRCNVYASRTLPGEPVRLSVHLEGQLYFWLTDPWFDGALWMKNEHPADPFAEQPSDNSRDSDLP